MRRQEAETLNAKTASYTHFMTVNGRRNVDFGKLAEERTRDRM